MSIDWEQHFIRDASSLAVLDGLNFSGRNIVEFGAGTGMLTAYLLGRGVEHLEAWEIDPKLQKPVDDERLVWRHRDITSAVPEDVAGLGVACFPPYSTLTFLLDLCGNVEDLMLMVPSKHEAACVSVGMRRIAALTGDEFTPPSTGQHLIMAKGF